MVAALTVLVKLAGMGKESLVAQAFGASAPLDAFLLALQIVGYLFTFVAGSLTAAFIPAYVRVRHERGGEEAGRLLGSVVLVIGGMGIAAALVLMACSGLLWQALGQRLGPEAGADIQTVFWILSAIPLLGCVSAVWGSTLNAHGQFAIPAAATLAIPLVTALAVALFAPQWGIVALAAGTTCGFAGEMAILGIGLRRQGVPLRPGWHGWNEPLRQIRDQAAPLLFGAALVNANPLVDQALAAALGPAGSVSALSYANKIPAAMQGILVISVGAVMLPHFSSQVALQDWRGVRATLRRWSLWLLLLTLPAMAALIGLSTIVVRLLFEHGQFTAADTQLVGQVQIFYLLQVPCYVVGMLGVRLLNALQGNRIVAAIGCVNVIVNVVGDLLLFRLFDRLGLPGIAGIALSTAVVYLISMLLIFTAIATRLRSLERENGERPINPRS